MEGHHGGHRDSEEGVREGRSARMDAWSLDLRLGGWAIHEEKASIFHPKPRQELTGEGARNSCPGPVDRGAFVW